MAASYHGPVTRLTGHDARRAWVGPSAILVVDRPCSNCTLWERLGGQATSARTAATPALLVRTRRLGPGSGQTSTTGVAAARCDSSLRN